MEEFKKNFQIYWTVFKDWFKNNGDMRCITIGFLLGLLSFHFWTALYISLIFTFFAFLQYKDEFKFEHITINNLFNLTTGSLLATLLHLL